VTESPLVAAYLADLDRALAGADPADRLEIVDAVREHIEASLAELGASPTQAEVAGVLHRLGTADEVAAAWAAGADRPGTPQGAWSGGPQLRPSAHGLVPIPPDEASARPQPVWLTVLLVVVGVVGAVPLTLLALPFVGAALGALVFLLPVLVVAGTIASGLQWRRSTTHRGAWLTAFVVGLVLVVGTATASAGLLAVRSGRSVEQTTQVNDAPTPMQSPLP